MKIQPMTTIDSLKDLSKIKPIDKVGKKIIEDKKEIKGNDFHVPFQDLFVDAAKNVVETDQKVNEDAVKLATGQSDNLHQYSIDMAKAQVSLELLVELRNKALDAYNEIIRMGV